MTAAADLERFAPERPVSLRPRVLVVHPQRQSSYQVVLAAQEAGLLQRFVTSYYWGSSGSSGRLLRMLCRLDWVRARLRTRWHPEVDASRVTSFPRYHLLAKSALTLLGPLHRASGLDPGQLADELFDRWASRWLMRQPRPSIVHAFEGGALDVLRSARRLGAVTLLGVTSAHEYGMREINAERRRHGLKQLKPQITRTHAEREWADLLLAESDYVVSCLVENGVDRSRIVLLPLGVEPDRFGPRVTPRNDQRFRVLFVGRVGFRKGVNYLLEAWRKLQLKDAELIITGGIDPEIRALLRDLPTSVRLLGNVSGSMIPALYQDADVLTLPSLSDGFGLVVLEAMASELPVIVTEACGAPVRDGADGYVVPIRDAQAIAERLERLHARPDLRVAMGQRGRQLVTERYTWRHYRRRMGAVYQAAGKTAAVQDAVDRA